VCRGSAKVGRCARRPKVAFRVANMLGSYSCPRASPQRHRNRKLPIGSGDVGHCIRDVEVGPDGALWMLEDSSSGGLFRVTPRAGRHRIFDGLRCEGDR
jgi:streptogramin lyase